MSEDFKTVRMSVSDRTMSHVDFVRHELGSETRTDAVAFALELAADVLNEVREGGTLILENANGAQCKLVFTRRRRPGLKAYR